MSKNKKKEGYSIKIFPMKTQLFPIRTFLRILAFNLLCLLSISSFGQSGQAAAEKPLRVVFQLVSGDSTDQKHLVRQLENFLSVAPDSRIEVVCQGSGLDLLTKEKSVVANQLDQFMKKGVVFSACEFAMKVRKIEKSSLLTVAGTVPSGLVEIVSKQHAGWAYVKAGK
jgi:intracellular sulfur oxidation DsrE/DsrF family protein